MGSEYTQMMQGGQGGGGGKSASSAAAATGAISFAGLGNGEGGLSPLGLIAVSLLGAAALIGLVIVAKK